MSKSTLPDGFKCPCGTFHRYDSYVYAHWDMRLTHTCDSCGAVHSIIRGTPFPQKPPQKKAKKIIKNFD